MAACRDQCSVSGSHAPSSSDHCDHRSIAERMEVYAAAVTDEYTIKALLLTVKATIFAVVFNTVFGVFAAWALTKFQFRGKRLLTTLIDLPVTISPVIAGLIFLLILDDRVLFTFFSEVRD